ncbi:MAG: hypothetical protein A2359_05025 [Candidatus Moranbacteria bacterium RIFOXYB1_FULL_43_19]|nr:MAG: hypothetical protein A2359_05025 [Candidatus Moranbacteria bacterium RIFOXYB1_FULL_43_19]OGI37159.1 MAG: hypothetical protein A2612_00195 [Candidatus Moranbacteria bacterium RIFOXYD1_FULL_44_12]
MQVTELIKSSETYKKVLNIKAEISAKKHDLEMAEATLKTQERNRESLISIRGSMNENRDGMRGTEGTIEKLKSAIENLEQELKIEEEKLQENKSGQSEEGEK